MLARAFPMQRLQPQDKPAFFQHAEGVAEWGNRACAA
jgi:hypothetical protein